VVAERIGDLHLPSPVDRFHAGPRISVLLRVQLLIFAVIGPSREPHIVSLSFGFRRAFRDRIRGGALPAKLQHSGHRADNNHSHGTHYCLFAIIAILTEPP